MMWNFTTIGNTGYKWHRLSIILLVFMWYPHGVKLKKTVGRLKKPVLEIGKIIHIAKCLVWALCNISGLTIWIRHINSYVYYEKIRHFKLVGWFKFCWPFANSFATFYQRFEIHSILWWSFFKFYFAGKKYLFYNISKLVNVWSSTFLFIDVSRWSFKSERLNVK